MIHAVLRSALALATLASPALAQEAATTSPPPTAGDLQLDLNALQPTAGACRVTFLATNRLGAALTKSTFELAIFGKDGGIQRVVLLDFKGLTAGKTKVVQFDLKDIDCGGVSRVLINDVTACEGEGIAASACLERLKTATKTGVDFGV